MFVFVSAFVFMSLCMFIDNGIDADGDLNVKVHVHIHVDVVVTVNGNGNGSGNKNGKQKAAVQTSYCLVTHLRGGKGGEYAPLKHRCWKGVRGIKGPKGGGTRH